MTSHSRVFEHIFGSSLVQSFDGQSGNFETLLSCASNHLQLLYYCPERTEHNGNGRIGNANVSFDLLELSNRISLFDSLKLIGVSHFGTVKTNCGVYQGKWQYEVLLLSTGVMQIGWVTSNSKFGPGQGVGDTFDSYAFDGSRVRKWNISAEDYGEKWEEGDIIGCCIDLDEGCLEFFRNGRSMGVAYRKIQIGPGIVYFPAISLQQKEGVIAIYGSTPLIYPVEGFNPIQEPPHKALASVTYLLDSTSKLLSLMDSRAVAPDNGPEISHEAVLMEAGKILIPCLTSFFTNSYVVDAKLIPFLKALCEAENMNVNRSHLRPSARVTKNSTSCSNNTQKMNTFLDLIWSFTERSYLKDWTNTLVTRLASKFQHNLRPLLLEFSQQKDAILILHSLLNHTKLRHFLMTHVLFEGIKFPLFMNIKLPSNGSTSFWETDPSIKLNTRAYTAAVNRISNGINSLEEMQVDMLLTLLDDSDGSSTQHSSRRIFLDKFRLLRRQFYALYRVESFKSPGSPVFLLWPFFLRLLRVLELLWPREIGSPIPDVVPSAKFYDGSISYYDIDRLGGVLLYLFKTFLNELERRFGVSQLAMLTQIDTRQDAHSVVDSTTSTFRNLTGPMDLNIEPYSDQLETTGTTQNTRQIEHSMDAQSFLSDILDGLILFYHIANRTDSLTDCINLSQNRVKDIVQCLTETKDTIKCFHSSSKHEPDVLKALESSYNVLLEHLHHATSHLAALHAMRYPCRHSWLFKVVLNTMVTSAEDENLFNFVPEFYLDCLLDMLKTLSFEAKPTFVSLEETPDRNQLTQRAVQFICEHVDDQRIRIAKAKDTLLIALLDIVTTPNLVEVLHAIPKASQMNMIKFLLQPYENRAWASSNWILVRIWHGSQASFASSGHWSQYHKYKLKPRPLSYPINPPGLECDPYPSYPLQELIQSILTSESELAISFLNSVLNQLNWAFSEFIGMLQELQNASNRQERVLVESRQLKICATCFDLTLALLRVLEMVSTLALPVFVSPDEPKSYFLLARLCQLLCQVLNRASSQDGCFHHITTLEIPGLENVEHLPILTATCGIILAILKEDIENFKEDKEHIKPEEMAKVSKMLTMLTHYHHILSQTNAVPVDEDEMCTICFAFPISTVFEPCKHHSCRACITHHLMNCKDCFFCKSLITKVVDDEGNVIFDTDQMQQLHDV
ncbi:E3 ubiquitin-protein ligase RNF123-like isoform X2 [Thrips palmi]|uniref:RING-type E3 ubiquitin transferase n=1 Tax=Thrips palmi TaxID=161013 RepID=A0A6P8Y7T6_THRPL|nr:E3 ubiquitin-protein ligase RNF123-like isoform X2 [Thrips palmi]